MRRLLLFPFLIAQVTCAIAACPAPSDLEAAEKLIGQAPSCATAATLARDCAIGASGDVGLVAAAEQVCQATFLSRLDRKALREFQAKRQACHRKYRNESGTMYRSFEAFCELRVSERFAKTDTARKR